MAHRQWAASGRRVRLESSSALSGGETDETVESRRKETSRDEPRRAAISDLQTNESNARRKLNLLVPMIGSDRKWTNCNQQALHVAAAAAGPVAYMCVFSSHCRCAAPLPRARHTRPPAGRPLVRLSFLSFPFRSVPLFLLYAPPPRFSFVQLSSPLHFHKRHLRFGHYYNYGTDGG